MANMKISALRKELERCPMDIPTATSLDDGEITGFIKDLIVVSPGAIVLSFTDNEDFALTVAQLYFVIAGQEGKNNIAVQMDWDKGTAGWIEDAGIIEGEYEENKLFLFGRKVASITLKEKKARQSKKAKLDGLRKEYQRESGFLLPMPRKKKP